MKVDNDLFYNKLNLSDASYRVAMFILHQEDDYVITKTKIVNQYKYGTRKINRIFKELEDKGYLFKNIIPRTKEDPSGVQWLFFENPNDLRKKEL